MGTKTQKPEKACEFFQAMCQVSNLNRNELFLEQGIYIYLSTACFSLNHMVSTVWILKYK